jgi:hypothetical protein
MDAGGEQAAQPPVVSSAPAVKPVEGAYSSNLQNQLFCTTFKYRF